MIGVRVGVLGLLGLVGCVPDPEPVAGSAPWIRVGSPKKHVVLIVVDTLRADMVERAHTPNLDALAAAGDSVPRAWSGSTWTVPSMISMFSGLPVRAHGWDFPFPRFMDQERESYPAIPDDIPLLAEVLQAEGFRTDGLYANGILRPGLGFERGFDSWTYTRDPRMAHDVEELVGSWGWAERHFLYVHFKGPHHPLKPTPRSTKRNRIVTRFQAKNSKNYPIGPATRNNGYARNYRRAYEAVVEDTDARIGAVLDALSWIRDDALIIVTSDHGEMLGEQGEWGHEHYVWEPVTQVPFIASGLGALPDTLNTTAVPALITAGVGVDRDWPDAGTFTSPIVSQRQGKLAVSPDGVAKGIWDPEAHQGVDLVTYDLSEDEGERLPTVWDRGPLRIARARWEAAVPGAEPLTSVRAQMDDEMLEMLGELGYMGDEGEIDLSAEEGEDDDSGGGDSQPTDEEDAEGDAAQNDESAATPAEPEPELEPEAQAGPPTE